MRVWRWASPRAPTLWRRGAWRSVASRPRWRRARTSRPPTWEGERVSAIKFGIAVGAYSAGVPSGRELADFARTAEAVGFDSVHVGDHIQWHAPIIESTVLLAT